MEEKFEVKGDWHFTQVDNAILEDERVTALDQSLYVALCSFANVHTKDCFPSYEKLMKRAHIGGRNTLSRALKRLEAYGFIKVEHPSGRRNIYTVWVKRDQYHSDTGQYHSDTGEYHDGTGEYQGDTLTRATNDSHQLEKNNDNVSPNGESTNVDINNIFKSLSKEQREIILSLPEDKRDKVISHMNSANQDV